MSVWKIVMIIGIWQIIVYLLVVAGIFGDIFQLLGIPWNPTGISNAIGIAAGWVFLEFPLIAGLSILYVWRKRRNRAGCCVKCGYDLRGAEHDVCPECGAAA